jgi:hypothetical protein
MGGGHTDAHDDMGLLDHPQPGHDGGAHEGRPSDMADSKTKPQGGNQDLWLLNLFFKGCALLV